MAPTEGLRPLGVLEVLDTATKLYRSQALNLWMAVAVVIVPLELVRFLIERAALSNVVLIDGTLYATAGGSTGGILPLLLTSLIGVLAELISVGAIFKLLLDAYLGRRVDLRESLSFAASKVGSLLWLSILSAIIVIVGFVLIIVPGVYALVALSVAVPVLMFEGLTGMAAMRRSQQLVSGLWWSTFGRLICAYIVYFVAVLVIGAVVGALIYGLAGSSVTFYLLLTSVAAGIGTILATPFISSVVAVIYIDLRVRKEALDLELLAGGLGSGGSPSGSPFGPPSPFDPPQPGGFAPQPQQNLRYSEPPSIPVQPYSMPEPATAPPQPEKPPEPQDPKNAPTMFSPAIKPPQPPPSSPPPASD
jgi:hypothetical protein